jgi:choice-of-anchor C domain-containing protein
MNHCRLLRLALILPLVFSTRLSGEDVPTDVLKRIEEFEAEKEAIQKKADAEKEVIQNNADAEIKVRQDKLIADLRTLQDTYAKLGKLDEAAAIGDRILHAENMIVNGSFEHGPKTYNDGHTNVELQVDSTDLVGWTVTRTQAGIIDSTYWKPADGDRSVAIPFGGGIQQTFKTNQGMKYKVMFRLAGDPLANPGEKKMQLSAAGKISPEFVFDTNNCSREEMHWARKIWQFTAESDETTLEIFGIVNENYGPTIDDVLVVEVKQ